jgi:hypothetical protein
VYRLSRRFLLSLYRRKLSVCRFCVDAAFRNSKECEYPSIWCVMFVSLENNAESEKSLSKLVPLLVYMLVDSALTDKSCMLDKLNARLRRCHAENGEM